MSLNELKILEWDEKQTNKHNNKKDFNTIYIITVV